MKNWRFLKYPAVRLQLQITKVQTLMLTVILLQWDCGAIHYLSPPLPPHIHFRRHWCFAPRSSENHMRGLIESKDQKTQRTSPSPAVAIQLYRNRSLGGVAPSGSPSKVTTASWTGDFWTAPSSAFVDLFWYRPSGYQRLLIYNIYRNIARGKSRT